MTPRAAQLKAKRKQNRAEIEERLLQAQEQQARDLERSKRQQQRDPIEDAATILLNALKNASPEGRSLAQQILNRAPAEVRALVMEKAAASSTFKRRRSNQRNGY